MNIEMSTLLLSVINEDGPYVEDTDSDSKDENEFQIYQGIDSQKGSTSTARTSVVHAADIKDSKQCKYDSLALVHLTQIETCINLSNPSTCVLSFCCLLILLLSRLVRASL